jgi:DNA-binding XRE family transcriptional regulator
MKYTVKQARQLAGKTQKQMAEALKIHVQTYQKIERKPENATVKQAKIISSETNVALDDIIF